MYTLYNLVIAILYSKCQEVSDGLREKCAADEGELTHAMSVGEVQEKEGQKVYSVRDTHSPMCSIAG